MFYKSDFENMLEDSDIPLELEDVTVKENFREVMKMDDIYGTVITPNGDIYYLTRYAMHGVVVAMLDKETADMIGVPQPTGSVGFLPTHAYQWYYLNMNKFTNLVTISSLGDTVGVRWGILEGKHPTDKQVESLGRILTHNHKNATIHGECGSGFCSVKEFMKEMYNGDWVQLADKESIEQEYKWANEDLEKEGFSFRFGE